MHVHSRLFFDFIHTFIGRIAYFGITIVDLFTEFGLIHFVLIVDLITTLADSSIDNLVENMWFEAALNHLIDIMFEATLNRLDLGKTHFLYVTVYVWWRGQQMLVS